MQLTAPGRPEPRFPSEGGPVIEPARSDRSHVADEATCAGPLGSRRPTTCTHRPGITFCVDLVPNHGSSAHPLFAAALAAPPGDVGCLRQRQTLAESTNAGYSATARKQYRLMLNR
jgi:hypothetical protein